MSPQFANAPLAPAGADAQKGRWRNALSGLTPGVLGLVAALLFMRTFSANGDRLILAVNDHKLGAWLWNQVDGWANLMIMAAPMLVVIIATANLGPQRGPARVAALAAAVILSSGAGAALRRMIGDFVSWEEAFPMISYVWPRYAILSGLLTAAGEFYRHQVASLKAMQQAEVDRIALEREMAEARLHVMQAQIEPHFLFNTLANVRRLYDKNHAGGAAMLGHLMRYLETALPRMRDNESTLDGEMGLVEAYLRIQQIRMGQRVAFSTDVPAELRPHPVPLMMLLTLVENAIKHGLDPSPDGGRIRIAAHADGDRLLLSVADTGVGFAAGSGTGTGLANIRARLAEQFGERASLALEHNELGGVTATIVLPLTVEVAAR